MKFDEHRVLSALFHSWSIVTAAQWSPDNPAKGQCNVTALLIHDLFGGVILKTPLAQGDHFYNRIDDARYDFTSSQFEQPIDYSDVVTDRDDAAQGTTRHELTTLQQAFEKHY
ncbi:MAG: YunG family protein [Hyphomicrobiaceae bacterium]